METVVQNILKDDAVVSFSVEEVRI
jgi:hypothetical protein